MKTRIYLFCNRGYGSAFLGALGAAATEMPDYDFHVVFSAKVARSALTRRVVRALGHPLKTWQTLHRTSAGGTLGVDNVADVNAGEFVESVPPGSIGFVAGFNQIFGRPLIDRFSTFLNFHPSLLPYYRGAIPSYWVLKNGETTTGLTVHAISERIDAGEILYQELVAINRHMSEAELDGKIATIGACYLHECLRTIAAGAPLRRDRVEPEYAVRVDYVPAKRE